MADNGSPQTPKISCRQNASSFFTSLHLGCFVSKGNNDTESTMSSPTSILDAKPLSALIKPFWSDSTTPKTPKPESKSLWDSRGVGLGLLDALTDEKSGSNLLKPDSRMVLGSQLKIRLPPLPHPVNSSNESPKSPVDFGIKNRNSRVDSSSSGSSPSPGKKWLNSGALNSLSGSEMELSEDYTCVISHGPNPKTTHIFDDCIVESCSGVVKFSESRKENGFFSNRWSMSYPSESFLSFCYTCKKNLGQGRDIYIYRGEKAFCSSECRYKEMLLEEETEETSDPDNVLSSSSQDPFHWLL